MQAEQVRYPTARKLVHTGDTEAASDMILDKARNRINMQRPDSPCIFIREVEQSLGVEALSFGPVSTLTPWAMTIDPVPGQQPEAEIFQDMGLALKLIHTRFFCILDAPTL